jgi:hypothetical protein
LARKVPRGLVLKVLLRWGTVGNLLERLINIYLLMAKATDFFERRVNALVCKLKANFSAADCSNFTPELF